jgi:hypothetical protein
MASQRQSSQQSSRRSTTRRPPQRTVAARTTARRRMAARAVPEKPDYSQDYADVRRDLKWIAIWSLLLMTGMVGGYFLF